MAALAQRLPQIIEECAERLSEADIQHLLGVVGDHLGFSLEEEDDEVGAVAALAARRASAAGGHGVHVGDRGGAGVEAGEEAEGEELGEEVVVEEEELAEEQYVQEQFGRDADQDSVGRGGGVDDDD